ncbi:class I SAM-dependent methyltransferase [Thalassotalea sp. 1_MG-2023]|uniref:class I SAM-dependent methyltransferase n=1 Tax=Thalassotalea sp. 1_MG-2023 TaxID=3062680 RepID=UPI0026E388BE|nr:class I SAM-dependent methyltransferase [Thalassotalea sp. 1_MG-2023]MDO6428902.1 class I SAM-dependent methyltransferase [Thalassotalea sp. 1_MG-2023]
MSNSLFSSKEILYQDFRPEYPPSIISDLESAFDIKLNGKIAEFGCGTGKLTKYLSGKNRHIYAVEPDKEMLDRVPMNNVSITKIIGTAENSKLSSSSIDFILSAQAFHHFEPVLSKDEFKRILKENGQIILLWYFSDMSQSIAREIRKTFYCFGRLLNQPKRMKITKHSIGSLFSEYNVSCKQVGTIEQTLNLNNFLGSMCSSSYAPKPSDSIFDDYKGEFVRLFGLHHKSGEVACRFNILAYHIF